MRIAVVCRTSGTVSGGMLKYLNTLVPLLGEQPGVDSVDLFVPEGTLPSLAQTMPARTWQDRFTLRDLHAAIRTSDPDVVFIPSARWINFGDIPVVTMVRNMEPLIAQSEKNSYEDRAKNAGRRAAARRATSRSQRIIAVSEAVRSFLIGEWHVRSERIGLVYHGVEQALPSDRLKPPQRAPTGQPFLFTAGSIRPARGLEDVIDAFSHSSCKDRYRLFVAGEAHRSSKAYAQRMKRRVREHGLDEQVVWLGNLRPEEMAWGYANCDAFIITSRVEACPNAALEALAYGCTIVATDCAPMPEILSGSALYYRAGEPLSLALNLDLAITATPEERRKLREEAILRARNFTWETTARRTTNELSYALAGV